MNDQKTIIYEQALNEYMRLALRLEYLFAQLNFHLKHQQRYDSHHALSALIDVLNLLDRPDIKSKLLQEFKRYQEQLQKWKNVSGVCTDSLREMLIELETMFNRLEQTSGKLGQKLRDHDFLSHVRQHMLSPGGTCASDTPTYHFWLQQPEAKRQRELMAWASELNLIEEAMRLLLNMARHSGNWRNVVAQEGFYQFSLDPHNPAQIIQIGISADCPFFPEISAGKHRICLRLLAMGAEERAIPVNDTVRLQMKLCAI